MYMDFIEIYSNIRSFLKLILVVRVSLLKQVSKSFTKRVCRLTMLEVIQETVPQGVKSISLH